MSVDKASVEFDIFIDFVQALVKERIISSPVKLCSISFLVLFEFKRSSSTHSSILSTFSGSSIESIQTSLGLRVFNLINTPLSPLFSISACISFERFCKTSFFFCQLI